MIDNAPTIRKIRMNHDGRVGWPEAFVDVWPSETVTHLGCEEWGGGVERPSLVCVVKPLDIDQLYEGSSVRVRGLIVDNRERTCPYVHPVVGYP